MERYKTAFQQPMVSNWDSYPNWLEKGSVTAETRADAVWKSLLATAQDPPLDVAVDAPLSDSVARRNAKGSAPMN